MKRIFLISVLLLGNIQILAQEIKDIPFDVGEVIERVSHNSRMGEEEGFLIDTSIVYIPAPGEQWFPSIAFDGTNYFVVWRDIRNGSWDIYGTRVSSSGKILDPLGIPICTTGEEQAYPSIAFGGTNYLVVWEDHRSSRPDIYGIRISLSGALLDSSEIPISTGLLDERNPCVAFDGENYLVVWQHERKVFNRDIYGARISPSGNLLDTLPLSISAKDYDQMSPAIVFDGRNYLVVWEEKHSDEDFDIYGARVSPSGSILDTAGIAISTAEYYQGCPSLAFDGRNYFIVWGDSRNVERDHPLCNIYGARVTPSGYVLDTSGIRIAPSKSRQEDPSIIFGRKNYLVAWEESYQLRCVRVNPSGSVLDSSSIAISIESRNKHYPSVAFDETNFFVVWVNEGYPLGPQSWDIYGARVNPSGSVLDTSGIIVSTAANHQEYPCVAFDGINYFVVWSSPRRYSFDNIYGARVSPSGSILDPSNIPISVGANHQSYPSIVFGRTNYFVSWLEHSGSLGDIYGVRISPLGSTLDFPSIPISTVHYRSYDHTLAFDETNYFIAWHDYRNIVNPFDPPYIYGARINPFGYVLDTLGVALSSLTEPHYGWRIHSLCAAFDGTNYLVVYEDSFNLYGIRVNSSGFVLDTSRIVICSKNRLGECRCPATAFDGMNYLVVWQIRFSRDYPPIHNIYGVRVSPSGMVLDTSEITICGAEGNRVEPAICFDGKNYLVVWEEYRNGTDSDIYGTWITPSGEVFDTLGVPISIQPGDQIQPAIAEGPKNQLLIVYSGWTPAPYNTMRIWGKFYGSAGIEEETEVKRLRLLPSHPNPFTKSTVISFQLPVKTVVSLKVYDVSGRFVRTLTRAQSLKPGAYTIEWDGEGEDGKLLPAGIYFISLEADSFCEVQKAIILR